MLLLLVVVQCAKKFYTISDFCIKIATQIMKWVTICSNLVAITII